MSEASTLVVIDTNTMPLEQVEGHPEARYQTLLRDETTGGHVQINYGPAGFTPKIRDLVARGPHRHFHRTVNERHYMLAGDYPVWHWPDRAARPTLTRVRRHHYLENRPLTLHGITAEATPEEGWKILQWTNGPGTELYQPGAEAETIEVGFDEADDDRRLYQRPVLIDTRNEAWRAHPSQPTWLYMPLAGSVEGSPPVCLVNIPAGARGDPGAIGGGADSWRWLLVVSGDLALKAVEAGGAGRDLRLTEGWFLAWSAGSVLTVAEHAPSRGGAVVLCAGHALAA